MCNITEKLEVVGREKVREDYAEFMVHKCRCSSLYREQANKQRFEHTHAYGFTYADTLKLSD